MHIALDPPVTPVYVPTCRAARAKWRTEEALWRRDYQACYPTYRLAVNMLVKEKPNSKFRICIDPSQTINKSIKRPKHTIPTIEEKVSLVTKAKVFTTLNVYLKHSKPLYWMEIPLYSRRFRGQTVAIAITTCRSVLLLVRRNTSGGSMNS